MFGCPLSSEDARHFGENLVLSRCRRERKEKKKKRKKKKKEETDPGSALPNHAPRSAAL